MSKGNAIEIRGRISEVQGIVIEDKEKNIQNITTKAKEAPLKVW